MVARAVSALAPLNEWVVDGQPADDPVRFEQQQQTLTFTFAQEAPDGGPDLPQKELVKRTWWTSEYRVPVLRCHLIIRFVSAIQSRGLAGPAR